MQRSRCRIPIRRVYIQLVSPTSGEPQVDRFPNSKLLVSIQLVSPTSGELDFGILWLLVTTCLHSISFPNEWGGSMGRSSGKS